MDVPPFINIGWDMSPCPIGIDAPEAYREAKKIKQKNNWCCRTATNYATEILHRSS